MNALTQFLWWAVLAGKLLIYAGARRRGPELRQWQALRVYMIFSVVAECLVFLVLDVYGIASLQYRNTYYFFDVTIAVVGYLVLVHLLEPLLEAVPLVQPLLWRGALLVLAALSAVSILMTFRQRNASFAVFAVDLEQNLSFVGMILTMLLLAGINALRVAGLRFRRTVLSFSVLYSCGAIVYSLLALFRPFSRWSFAPPAATLLAVLLLGVAVWAPDEYHKPRNSFAWRRWPPAAQAVHFAPALATPAGRAEASTSGAARVHPEKLNCRTAKPL